MSGGSRRAASRSSAHGGLSATRPSRAPPAAPALPCPAGGACGRRGMAGMALAAPALRRYLLLLAQEHLEFRLPVSAARERGRHWERGRLRRCPPLAGPPGRCRTARPRLCRGSRTRRGPLSPGEPGLGAPSTPSLAASRGKGPPGVRLLPRPAPGSWRASALWL